MERVKPAMEQILAVRSPLSWLSERSFSAAQSQARRMEPAGSRGQLRRWQGHS